MTSSEPNIRRRIAGDDSTQRETAPAPLKQPTFERVDNPPDSYVFLYDRRVACAFVPCLVILLVFGGKTLVWTLVAGILAVVLSDYFGVKEGIFISVWSTLAAAQLILLTTGFFYLKRTLFNILLMFNFGIIVSLTGVWLTLHLGQVAELSKPFIKLLERILFVASPLPVASILTWATTAFLGITNAPFYFMAYLFAAFYIFLLPLKSSFETIQSSHQAQNMVFPNEKYICGRFETIVQTLSLSGIPVLFYTAIHHNGLLTSNMDICNILISFFAPVLFLRAMSEKGALWWLDYSEEKKNAVKSIMLYSSVFALVGCFEYRVIFTSFYHYISLPSPLNYIIVTVGMYSLVFAILTHFSGLAGSLNIFLAVTLVELSALAWSFVLGIPILLIPIPLIGGYFLTTFYYRRKIRDYLITTICAALCLIWFSKKTLWFLDYNFSMVSWSVQTVSLVLIALFVLIFVGPGLLLMGDSNALLGVVLVVHAMGLSFMEQLFHTEGEDVYPPTLVLFTSALGSYLANKLESQNRITKQIKWALVSIYLSKLSILLGSSEMAIPSVLLLALTISPSLYWRNSPEMSATQGIFHFLTIGIACFLTRHTFQEQLLTFFTGQRPNESVIFSFFVVSWAVNTLPLSYWYFPHVQNAKRLNVILLLSGIFFGFLQPNVDMLASLSLRQTYSTISTSDDSASWASWLLFVAFIMALMGLTSFVPFSTSSVVRMLYSSVFGCFVGLYICAAYLPNLHGLYVLTVGLFVLSSIFLAFVQWPNVIVSKFMPLLFAFLTVSPVVIYIVATEFLFASLPSTTTRDFINICANAFASIYAAVHLLISFVIKNKVSIQPGKEGLHTTGIAGLPLIGSLSAFLSLGYCLFISLDMMHSQETAIAIFAPILLLLNRDPYLLKNLNSHNRYLPVVLVASSLLFTFSTKHILDPLDVHASALGIYQVKNTLMLLLCVPSTVFLFPVFALRGRLSESIWFMILPLNILALILTDLSHVRVLALIGLVGGCHRLYRSRQNIQKGNKLI